MVQIVFLANVMSDEMIGNGTFTKPPTTTIGTTSTTITTKTTVETQSLRNASRDRNGPDPAKSDI